MSVNPVVKAGGSDEVRVLARGLALLKAFAPRNDWKSNQELAEAVALPRPTISRLTSNLLKMGYLEYSAERGLYRLGTAVLTLGFAARSAMGIHVLARPLLQDFADREDTTAVLATREGVAMFCHEVCHGHHMVALRVNPGSRLVLPYSAMGRALIGALPAGERLALLGEIRRKFPKHWPQLEVELADAVSQMAAKSFCTTIGTLESGVNGAGVVVDWPGAPHIYVIGCAGPAARHPRERIEQELGPRLLAIKAALQAKLAHAPIEPAGEPAGQRTGEVAA